MTKLFILLCAFSCGVYAVRGFASPVTTFEAGRDVYVRGETANLTAHLNGKPGDRVIFSVEGISETLRRDLPLADDGRMVYALDTHSLHSGNYVVLAELRRDGKVIERISRPLTIGLPHDPDRLPVWRWGHLYRPQQVDWFQQRGFTGGTLSIDTDPVTNQTVNKGKVAVLERAAQVDFAVGGYLYPLLSKKLKENPEARVMLGTGQRMKVKADPYPNCPLEPVVLDYTQKTARSWMQQYGSYPALRYALLSSEYRVRQGWNQPVKELAQKDLHLNSTDFFSKNAWFKTIPAGQVHQGVVEDDNPYYRIRQWWYRQGSGLPQINRLMNDIIKKDRPDVLTWHDPYRAALVRGGAAGLNALATWTYGQPTPKRLLFTTYLQAFARPDHQLVQQNITLYVYGKWVVPLKNSTADLHMDFGGRDPYFTAGPDYATMATWLTLSQRPDILAYYWASRLPPDDPKVDPKVSSPQTFDAIGKLADQLIKPYGPAILKSRRHKARTALLASAAAQWFAPPKPHLEGNSNEQTLPYAELLAMNHMPFDVLLDEDVAGGALKDYDVLVIPQAGALLKSAYKQIVAFAGRGGQVIADSSLKASIPGVHLTDFDFSYQTRMNGKALADGKAVTAQENRRIMEGYAAKLGALLETSTRPADSDSVRVLTNTLDGGAVRYHFFVNDNWTYGPRFGRWKLRMESGVAQSARCRVDAKDNVVLYDALEHRSLDSNRAGGKASFNLSLSAGGGKLIAALPEAIGRVLVQAPAKAERGQKITLVLAVQGASGDTIAGVLPLHVEVLDPQGKATDWDRFTATSADGRAEFTFTPAVNRPAGAWKVRVTDLLGNQTGEAVIQCK